MSSLYRPYIWTPSSLVGSVRYCSNHCRDRSIILSFSALSLLTNIIVYMGDSNIFRGHVLAKGLYIGNSIPWKDIHSNQMLISWVRIHAAIVILAQISEHPRVYIREQAMPLYIIAEHLSARRLILLPTSSVLLCTYVCMYVRHS